MLTTDSVVILFLNLLNITGASTVPPSIAATS